MSQNHPPQEGHTMRIHSERAWNVASMFAYALASSTRDLAAAIDEAYPDWQLIETAPRDGTRFMAFEKGDEFQRYECWWQNDFGHWEGWQNDLDNEPNPTHWKPLDPAPETAG
jgi:hypothetical protein